MKNQIIIAMDNEIQDGIELIGKTEFSEEIYGYKIGSLWILDKGKQILKELKETVLHDSERKLILDMQKWGTDIPDIIKKQVDKVAPYVDEIICCPMGGGPDDIKAFDESCKKYNVNPICVLKMTHPNAEKYLKPYTDIRILEDCLLNNVTRFVIPATKEPNKEIQNVINKYTHPSFTTIYATGFKAQGGQTKPMVDFGVTKFIVGRAVYEAKDPIKAIESIYKEINEV